MSELTREDWRQYLHERGVHDTQIAARGYRWVLSGKPGPDGAFAAEYGFPQKSAGILIPLHPLTGGHAYQLRDATGQRAKFLTPRGQRNVLSTSPLIDRAIFQRGGEAAPVLWIVEGVTRVDALARFGIPALGLTGISSWRGKNSQGGTTRIADFDEVNIKGRDFVLAPDGDVSTNRTVNAAVTALSDMLKARGARVVAVLMSAPMIKDWTTSSLARSLNRSMT